MALSDKDVDEDIASDWAKITEKYAAPEPETPPTDPDDGGEDDSAKPESIPVSREADGKFKARDDKTPKPEAAEKEPKPAKGAPKDAATEAAAAPAAEGDAPAPQRDVNRPPSSWKPLARAEWDKLSPAIRAEVHRREQDFQNGQSQLLPDAQFGKTLREIIHPYEMMIQAEGGTPELAVRDLFRTAAVFRGGNVGLKYQAIAQIANQFGLDLRRFAPQQGQQAPPAPQGQQPLRDPRVDQLLAQQEQERRVAADRETRELDSTVTRWINEADAQGNPKRPYLNDVINEMMPLVTHFKQANPGMSHQEALDRAYESATWAHPEVRQLLSKAQQTELEQKRRAENQSRVRDARRAGSVNTPRRASTPTPAKPGSIEETLRETARELGFFD